MPGKIIAVIAQKGGTGKTTSAASIAAGLHKAGKKVLMIDLDPQRSLSLMLGAGSGPNIYDVLIESRPAARSIQHTAQGDLIAADSRLASKGILSRRGDETRLKSVLTPLLSEYDAILIDCPPSLGTLTVNAMIAADGLIIPLKADRFSLDALHELHNTISAINNKLTVYGILITQYTGRACAPRLMLEEITEHAEKLGYSVYDPPIRRTIALEEIQITGGNIFDNPRNGAAQDYQNIVDKLMKQLRKGAK